MTAGHYAYIPWRVQKNYGYIYKLKPQLPSPNLSSRLQMILCPFLLLIISYFLFPF